MKAAYALQRAIRAALLADNAVKAVFGDPARVFDAAPADAQTPFAVFSETRVRPIGPRLAEHDVRLSVLSSYRGRREAQAALVAIHDALNERDLTLEGASLISLRVVFSDCFWRPEQDRASGVIRLRAVTEQP
jgi:hypothetical protein